VHLSFFTEIGKAIVSAKNIKEILSQVMDKVGTIFAPLNWSLLLHDHKTNELVFQVAVGVAADKLRSVRIPTDLGISGWIFNTGQSVIIEDVDKDKRFSRHIDAMTGFKTKSIIGVPLKTGNRVLGIIELVNKLDGGIFTPFELKLLSSIADFAAIAIERAFYIQAIHKLSRIDHLTGVLNRRAMDMILSQEIERCQRYQTELSILMIDINDFKRINDKYGHLVGDDVLVECARIIQRNIRKIDYVARYGGDEFAVIMPNTPRLPAEKVKERILADLEKTVKKGNCPPFGVSIGLQTSGPDGVCDLLNKTDVDLYRQKAGREPIKVYENLLDYIADEEDEEITS
ncbi:MAG: sensor domain-containing diguanylate cyclase, partial [Spirochaetota bacterium]